MKSFLGWAFPNDQSFRKTNNDRLGIVSAQCFRKHLTTNRPFLVFLKLNYMLQNCSRLQSDDDNSKIPTGYNSSTVIVMKWLVGLQKS